MNELAALLAALPGVVETLLARHVPDGHGRCSACVQVGVSNQAWPCALAFYAESARDQSRRATLATSAAPP